MNRLSARLAKLVTLLWLASGSAMAAEPAGTVALLAGQATASDATTMGIRTLTKGDPVYPGELIGTGSNSYVNLKFTDGGFILLRPNSRFEIEDFSNPAGTRTAAAPTATPAPAAPSTPTPKSIATATPQPTTASVAQPNPTPGVATASPPTTTRAFFKLLKGGFRAVSGLIGKQNPDEYRISTPVATIGIRGTDYWVILCDELCAQDPVLLDNLPPGVTPQGGIIVGVIHGTIFVGDPNGQGSSVNEGQYLITLPDGKQLYLPYEPRFIKIQPIPDPTTLCEPE